MTDPSYWTLEYINGKKIDGLFQMFHKNGALKSEVVYKRNDKPSTNWIYYDKDGRKEKRGCVQKWKNLFTRNILNENLFFDLLFPLFVKYEYN